MRKMIFMFLMVLFSSSFALAAEEGSAGHLVATSWELYRRAEVEKELVEVTVSYGNGRREEKVLTRWTNYDQNGEDRISVRFTRPAADHGLGLLTWRHPGQSDDQWLKLPSLDRVRRISSADQEKYFAGTDFTYEDLRQLAGERTADFDYLFLRMEGEQRVIEATPKKGTDSVYGKRHFWIDGRSAIAKIEYFSGDGRLIKIQKHSGIVYQPNGLWRADLIEVENLLLERKTVMKVTERVLDSTLPVDVFSRKYLESTPR